MAAILEGLATSTDVCAFEDYESLESGLSREYIAAELLAPSTHQTLRSEKPDWHFCKLHRPSKDEFRLVDEATKRFMLSAKMVGIQFYISTYEEGELGQPTSPTSPTSPKANYAAVMTPHVGGRRSLSFRVHLTCGPTPWEQCDLPIIEVWPTRTYEHHNMEIRGLRIRIPPPLQDQIPAHYIHDCASPTNRRPSHPGFFKSNDVRGTIQLQNKLPAWNEQLGCLSLGFAHKRVKQSSSKNFIVYTDDCLADPDQAGHSEASVLQLGKVQSKEYALDFRYPLSPLQAFAVALTAFAMKHLPTELR